jgi:hypothetical protein
MAALVLLDCPTEEDPACEWTTPSGPLLTLTFSSVEAPNNGSALVKVGAIPTPFGGWLKLVLRPTQSSPTKETTFKFTLSADLIVKS